MSTYQKYKCVDITECKLYMRVDDTKLQERQSSVYEYDTKNTEYRIISEYYSVINWLFLYWPWYRFEVNVLSQGP